jgi:aspartokinase/homoserine dehydrogenase 1
MKAPKTEGIVPHQTDEQTKMVKKWRVMKFGGTSVGFPDRLARVIKIVDSARSESPVVVVVSAMEHTTDRLLESAHLAAKGDLDGAERVVDAIADLTTSNCLLTIRLLEEECGASKSKFQPTPVVREMLKPLRALLSGVALLRECTPQTLDLVLSFGERLSATVIAGLMNSRGIPARFVDSRDFMVTDDHFGMAQVITPLARERLRLIIQEPTDEVPVVTGFLGRTKDGRTTTLGRNGSDYTATLLAQWLDASEVVIWTDVSGVMTADPAIVKDAYPLAQMSYMEALELADFGASMFHPMTMIPLIESGIPMRIRNTMNPDDPGTLVGGALTKGRATATCVTSLENLALLGVQVRRIAKRASLGGRVLRALEEAHLTVWLATQSAHGQAVAVVLPISEVDEATKVIHDALARELERGEVEPVTVHKPVTLLTLVGEGMAQTVGVAGRFFSALGAVGIPIHAVGQGASARSISCVVDAKDTLDAVRTVHAAFNFAHQQVSLLVLGRGTVGGALLRQVCEQRDSLLSQHDVLLNIVGVAWSTGAVFDEDGVSREQWEGNEASSKGSLGDIIALLERLRRLPVPILVDCTAADGMETLYKEAFARGIHVVSANKKPLTIPWQERESLMQSARTAHRAYLYETTVGAGLPVIETLKNLVRTGDKVLLVEGCFSGSLGFISNEMMRGARMSEALRKAMELGFTEPNPLDDLSGMDVARKALILAREMDIPLDLDDVSLKPFVVLDIGKDATPEDVLKALEKLDSHMAYVVEREKASNRVLRYLARIDPREAGHGRPVVRVEPVFVESDHLSTRLRGTEAFVAFTTKRYHDYPLLVQGAGAGGEVTAGGVLTDILKVSMMLRGR